MKRLSLALISGMLALGVQAQDTTDKQALKYKFKKGETVKLDLIYELSAKLDEVPEIFQGALAENLADLKMKGKVEAVVAEVNDAGVATLKGKWKTLKAKGHFVVNDVDMDYDAERDKDKERPKKPDAGDDAFGGGGFPGADIEQSLWTMVDEELVLKVKPTGAVSTEGETGLAGRALSLNGLMGPFPDKKVGRGDSWKGNTDFKLPGMALPISFLIESKNTLGDQEKVGDLDCTVITSAYTVKGADSEAAEALGAKIEVKGEGKGSMHFASAKGRPAKALSEIKARISIGGQDPTSGEELAIKATVKIKQGYTLAQ